MLNKLNSAKFKAYLVGGSVRDLLLHKSPKDFDIATDAKPNQIKKLFRNARIIGRRFKLVHIIYHREIIEVATFRSSHSIDINNQCNERGMLINDNVYGTIEDDAWRRDFTVNSLYYDIESGAIIDFTGGVHDIKNKIIKIIGDASVRYQEDPVRMLRAIRFAAKLDFKIAEETSAAIFKLNHLINHVSSARLFDEMVKIYQCGAAKKSQELLESFLLFNKIYPQVTEIKEQEYPIKAFINLALENTDSRVNSGKSVTPAFLCAIFLWFPFLKQVDILKAQNIEPLPAIEQAMAHVINTQNQVMIIPKRFTQVMKEIWMLQYRFPKRKGRRAQNLLHHPRFRAAYDFMALRAIIGDESIELANWWTTFQEVDENTQEQMAEEIKN